MRIVLGARRLRPVSRRRRFLVDALTLPNVSAVVSYYLANPAPIDECLSVCAEKAEATRQKLEVASMTGGVGKEELPA